VIIKYVTDENFFGGKMKTHDKILKLLKTQGALTAKTLADELELTTMGIRQHMLSLEKADEVTFEDKKAARGRPTRYWSLTTKADNHFSDHHDELTIQLMDSVIAVFGDDGLEKIIADREKASMKAYRLALADRYGVEEKLATLAKLRSDEGYMATVTDEGGSYHLLENHCPICVAATKHISFCQSELQLFQNLLDDVAVVTREEHILAGARRCVYKVTPL
jgi:predicted ArsR family transcriptional regulator